MTGEGGIFQQLNDKNSAMTVKEYKKMALSNKYKPPDATLDKLESIYWEHVNDKCRPIYGSDFHCTLFDDDVTPNLNHLDSILNCIVDDCEISIEGVNTSFVCSLIRVICAHRNVGLKASKTLSLQSDT